MLYALACEKIRGRIVWSRCDFELFIFIFSNVSQFIQRTLSQLAKADIVEVPISHNGNYFKYSSDGPQEIGGSATRWILLNACDVGLVVSNDSACMNIFTTIGSDLC